MECKLEEFFLTSWVNGDPAMVVGYERDKDGRTRRTAMDGSSRRRGILMIRLMCIIPISTTRSASGTCMRAPKKPMCSIYMRTNGLEDKHDPLSLPGFRRFHLGTTFSYEVHYGGSGNRNLGRAIPFSIATSIPILRKGCGNFGGPRRLRMVCSEREHLTLKKRSAKPTILGGTIFPGCRNRGTLNPAIVHCRVPHYPYADGSDAKDQRFQG